MNPMRRSPSLLGEISSYKSGVQGGRWHFDSILILFMNFERPTTCRYDMPHVVAYVVAYVVLDRVLSAFVGCGHAALHALVGNGPQACITMAILRSQIGVGFHPELPAGRAEVL